MASYLFAPSPRNTTQRRRGRRWRRWPLKQSGRLVSGDGKTASIQAIISWLWLRTADTLWDANSKTLTVSSRGIVVIFLVAFSLLMTLSSVGQSGAPPTICPWIAVPRTVPKTSTVMPERYTERELSNNNSSTCEKIDSDHTGALTYDRQWQSLSLSGPCWWTWWEPSMARESTAKWWKGVVRLISAHSSHEQHNEWQRTHRLHWLEEAVKNQVPEDLPVLKRRHVPHQEVGQHCKRRREEDPGKRRYGANLYKWFVVFSGSIVFCLLIKT